MKRRSPEVPSRGCTAVIAAILVAGCGGASPGTVVPAPATPRAIAATAAATASAPPTAAPEPSRAAASTDMPAGYRIDRTVPFGFGLVVGDVLMGWNMDVGEVYRWDAVTLEDLGVLTFGGRGARPPDAQSAAAGSDGVWVNLGSQHAVALIDPVTGKVTRRVEIPGYPYDMIEVAGDLWIADFEWQEVTRYDLATDKVVAKIPVSAPTDILFGEGAIWAPLHLGRTSDAEPIDGPGGQLVGIDPATNQIDDRIDVGHRPYYLASGFGSVWMGNATSASVSRVDVASNEATTVLVGEDGAFDIEVVGDSVWVVVGPQWPPDRLCDPATSFFVRIDPATNAVREWVAFPCPTSITPDGAGFWVSGMDADGPVSRRFVPGA